MWLHIVTKFIQLSLLRSARLPLHLTLTKAQTQISTIIAQLRKIDKSYALRIPKLLYKNDTLQEGYRNIRFRLPESDIPDSLIHLYAKTSNKSNKGCSVGVFGIRTGLNILSIKDI